MSRSRVVGIDSVEHAQLVLKTLRKSSSAQNRYGNTSGPTLSAFDDMIVQTGVALSDKIKMDQRIERLIAQEPSVHSAESSSMILRESKELGSPYELSPEKEAALYKSSRNNRDYESVKFNMGGSNHSNIKQKKKQTNPLNIANEDDIDFSSDDDNESYLTAPKLERVALNRPAHKSGNGQKQQHRDERDDDDEAALRELALEGNMHSPSSPNANNNSFYDDAETLDTDDDDDNAALFKGFTAPTISDLSLSQRSGPSQLQSHHPHSLPQQSKSTTLKSTSSSVLSSNPSSSGGGMKISKAPGVPDSHVIKELNNRGVVVGKGGIFIRAGGRKKKHADAM